MRKPQLFLLGALSAAALLLGNLSVDQQVRAAGATNLSGSVKTTDGKALEGVAVSARADDQRFTTSVYSDASGSYSFPELGAGHYKIWAQTIGFDAAVKEADLNGSKKIDLVLLKLANVEKQLSGPELLASLPGEGTADRRMREVFANVCTSCHSASFPLQNRFDAAGWGVIVSTMSRTSPTGVVTREGVAFDESLAKGQQYVIGAYKDELVAYLAKVREPTRPRSTSKRSLGLRGMPQKL